MEPICPHSIQAFLDEGDSSTGVWDPGSSHHVTLQSSAPGSQGCPTIGPQSRELFSKVGLLLCRGQVLWLNLPPHIFSLKQNLTHLVSLWQTAQPPCPSPDILRERRERSGMANGLEILEGSREQTIDYSMNVQGLGLKVGLSMRKGALNLLC